MDSIETLIALIVSIVVIGVSFYMARKPKEPGKPWSLPWNGILFISILVAILMISHMGTLYKNAEGSLF